MSEWLKKIWEGTEFDNIDLWEENEGRHRVLPNRNFRRFLRVLGMDREGVRVLFPCPYSGEYLRIIQKIVRNRNNVVTVDIALYQLKRSGTRQGIAGDVRRVPLRDNAFTHVISFEPTPLLGFGGLRNVLLTLREMIRVTRPGGIIAILHGLDPHTMPGIDSIASKLGTPVATRDLAPFTTGNARAILLFITDTEVKRRALKQLDKLLKAGDAGKWDVLLRSKIVRAYLRALGIRPGDLRK